MSSQKLNLLEKFKSIKRSGNYKRLKAKKVEAIMKSLGTASHLTTYSELRFSPKNGPAAVSAVLDVDVNNSEFLQNIPGTSSSVHCDSVPNENALSSLPPKIKQIVSEACVMDDYSDGFDKDKFISEIVIWAIKYRLNNVQLKGFLEIWNRTVPLPQLPCDPRTLLHTPRMLNIFTNTNTNEKYWYYGLRKSLGNVLATIAELPEKLSLNINSDGLPISNASTECLWPLLYNIHELPEIKPMVISIFHGKGEL